MDFVNPAGHQDCSHLAKELWRCHNTLELVVFGHIHEGHGREDLPYDRIQQLHDNIRLGTSGVVALIELVFWVLFERLGHLFPTVERGKHCGITMVNAAVVTRPWERDSRSPIVVEI